MDSPPSRPAGDDTPPSHRPYRYAVPVMALAAGLIFGTSAALARTEPLTASEPSNLADLIEQRTGAVERLTDQVRDLSAEVEQLERDTSGSALTTQISQQADALAPEVGLGPVRGPAVQVTLDDAGYTLDTLPQGYNVDDVVVHQQDVQAVVNALWAGGAEAMMIQDQRVISSSAVQCVGNTLYLQGRVYSPPYTITAIGDIEALQTSLDQDPIVDNYRGWSETLGLGYVVEPLDTIDFPGFASIPRPEYVRLPGVDPEESLTEQTGSPDGIGRG